MMHERLSDTVWRALDRLSTIRYASIGVSLTRISLGLVALYTYAVGYGDRWLLWGPKGLWPWSNFTALLDETRSFSLYSISSGSMWFDVVFHLGIVVAVLFTLGWKTRLMTTLHWLFLWSLYERNPTLLDAGDILMNITLIYFVAVDGGRYLSLDAHRGRVSRTGTYRYRLGSLLHNAGLAAVLLQLCIVYLTSAMFKLQGEQWQDGTALHYIMQWHPYPWPTWISAVYDNMSVVVLLTYGTVLIQLSFPYLLLNRRTRALAVVGILGMHVGIALVMGLLTFSWVMMSFEFMVLTDHDYQRLLAWSRKHRPRPQRRRAISMGATQA